MGPVLVYCNIQLADEIKAIGCPTLMADCNVDPEILRHLDTKVNNQYIVVIAMDQFGMRGIDYRSVDAVMALVVDKSFDNYREAV